jgi:hypothetical protein
MTCGNLGKSGLIARVNQVAWGEAKVGGQRNKRHGSLGPQMGEPRICPT